MARISENSINSLTTDWGKDESNGLPYSGKAVLDFIKSLFIDQLNETETKYGYSEFTDGALIFYDKEGGTELTKIQFSGTNYIVDFGTAKNLTVLTSDESYYLPITPKSYSIELGSTNREEMVEDYTFKIEVDTGKGFVDLNVQDNSIKYGTTKHIDIRKMLVVGVNRVRVIVTGIESKQSKAIVYTTTLTSLTLECKHSWNNVWFGGLSYKINNIFFSGNVKKDLCVEINGNVYTQQFTSNSEYKSVPYEFDVTDKFKDLETGIIPIKVWIESDNVRTKEYQFNVMYVAPGDENVLLICLNNIPDEVYNFEQSNLFMYALYNLSEVTISIKLDINGTISQIGEPKTLINLQQQYRYSEKVSLNINTELTDGIYVVFDINGIEGRISLNNSKAYLATEGHVFYMNPSLRSNNTDDKKLWYNSSDNTKINAEWDNFTFSDDGWTLDLNGNSALVVKAGSNVIVPNFKPFKPTDSLNSKTFEFMFKSANIADYDTPIFLAISTDSFDINNKNCVGLVLYPTRLLIVTNNERQELFQQLPLSENRIIHVAVVVQREYASNSATNLIRIFINGCENVTFSIQNSSALYLESDYNYLKIGLSSSDFYLYLLRLYNKALSGGLILANYLNALIESTEISRQGIKHDNDILDGGSISYDICKLAGYNTMVIETDKDIPSLKNSNTENLRVNILLEYNDHPEWNVKINNTPLDGQGTTSSKYAKWNLRSKVDKNAIWEYADGTKTTGKEGYIAGPDNPKSSKITWKKNIASQPQGHKMGATSFYNDLFKKVLGDVYIQENFPSENVRVAVYQYPFMGFLKFSDGTYKFIGLYTGGPDKTDKKTFGYNETDAYPKLMMIEGPNHKPLLTRFLTPWTDDVFYDQSQETLSIGDPNGEKEEGWDADIAGDFDTEEDNILPLYESEFKPAYDAIFYNSVYIASLKEANAENIFDDSFDVLTFRDKTTTIPLPDGTTKTFSNELMTFYDDNYKLIYYDVKTKKYKILNSHNLLDYLKLSGTPSTLDIITARLNQWQEKVGQYVSLYEAYYHTCFCELIGASDNDAKNTYWRKFKSLEDGGLWGFQQDDLDTIFQNDNNGQDTKNYYAEHDDVNANGGDIFQGRTSAFWTTLRIVCKNEILNTMNKLVEKALELAELLNLTKSTQHETMFNLIKYYFWDHSSKYFSATAYNEDTQWAYIDVWYENPSATYNSVPPLTQIHGDHFETEYDWVEKRIAYMFSKYQIGAYKAGNEDGYGSLDFTCGEAFTLNIVPAIAQYPRISKGGESTQSISARTLEGETFQIAVEASKDTGTYIKGMHWISDLGDLSGLKLNSRGGTTEIVFTVNSKRLRRLILGNDETPKFNATNILLTCEGLEILNAKNVDDLNTVVDLSQCPRIKEIDLTGTRVPQVILPEGGRVEKLYLPGTLNTLILNDLQLLNDLYIEDYSTILKIYCHSNNAVDILQNILNLETNNITHIGLKWDEVITISDSKFLSMLANLTAKKENGDYVYSSAKIDEKGTLKTDDTFKTPPFIQGRIYIDNYVYLSEVEAITSNLDVQIEYNPDKIYIPFEDAAFQELVADTYGDGIGVTQELLDAVISIPLYQWNSDTTVKNIKDLYKFRNLKSIGGFGLSQSAKNVTVPETVVGGLGRVTVSILDNLIIGEGITTLTQSLFQSGVSAFVIPNSVTTLNNLVFDSMKNGGLKKLVYGENTKILTDKNHAYRDVSLEELYVPTMNFLLTSDAIGGKTTSTIVYVGKIDPIKENKGIYGDVLVGYNWDKLEGTGDYADKGEYEGKRQLVTTQMINEVLQDTSITKWKNIGNLKQLNGELIIPSHITILGTINSTKIEKITINSNLITAIPNYFAQYNTALKEITIPNNVTSIGDYAFQGCTGLTSIEIPNSITSIGWGALNNCLLENFTIEDTSKITSMATIYNTIIKNLYVNDLKPLYKFQFKNNYASNNSTNIYVNGELVKDVFIDYIEGVNDVTLLFQGSTITSAKIAEGYTYANSGPFEQCSKIRLVDFPSTIRSIGWIRYMMSGVTLIVRASTPPGTETFFGNYGSIYVPDESVEAYKTANTWSSLANKIFPISNESLPEEVDNKVIWSNVELTPGAIATPEIGSVHTFTKTNSNTIYSAIIDLENVDFVKIDGIMNSSTNRFWCLVDENNIVTATSDVAAYYNESLVPISVNDKKMSKLIVNLNKSVYNNTYVKIGDASNYYVRFEDYAFQKLVADTYGDGYGVTQKQLDKVTSIAIAKFQGNKSIQYLTDLYKFRNLKKLEWNSFQSTLNLKEVIIPKNVQMADSVFQYAPLSKFILPKDYTGTYFGGSLLGQNPGLACLQNLYIPDSVVNVANYAFDYQNLLKTLILGSGLTNIETASRSFTPNVYIKSLLQWLNMITTFYISSGKKLYLYNDIEEITEDKDIYGTITVDYNWDKLEQERVLVNTQMFNEALKSITSIRNNAFRNCTQLKGELVIPDNITSIGSNAFSYCYGFTSIVIGNGIKSITPLAFYDCANVTSVIIGNGVISIGNSAFAYVRNLKTIICQSITPPELGTNVFSYTNNSFIIYVPDEAVEGEFGYKKANGWSAYADRIKPLSEIEGIKLYPVDDFVFKVTTLKTTYTGIEVTPEYTIEGTAATIEDGVLTFSEAGEVTVTATYNGESVSRTYSWNGIIDITNLMESKVQRLTTPNIVGQKCAYQSITDDSTSSIVLDTNELNALILRGEGGQNARLYCFIDENDIIVDVSNAREKFLTDTIIQIPDTAVKVIINYITYWGTTDIKLQVLYK